MNLRFAFVICLRVRMASDRCQSESGLRDRGFVGIAHEGCQEISKRRLLYVMIPHLS